MGLGVVDGSMFPPIPKAIVPVLEPENWHRGLILILYVLVSVLGLPLLSVTVTVKDIFVPETVGVPLIVKVSLVRFVVDKLQVSPWGRVADQVNGRVIAPVAIINAVAV